MKNKFLPTISLSFISAILLWFARQYYTINKETIIFFVAVVVLYSFLNLLFLLLLQNTLSKGAASISALVGISGASMFAFVALLLAYQPITKSEMSMPVAATLFILYALYKISLLLPVLWK